VLALFRKENLAVNNAPEKLKVFVGKILYGTCYTKIPLPKHGL
jgi:hypothetical protein